jgi:hypothetical protein
MRRLALVIVVFPALLAAAFVVALVREARRVSACALCDGDHPTLDHGFTEAGW